MPGLWEHEYECKFLKREVPRFVPPIEFESVESEIDLGPVQPVLEIEGDSWLYMLVGTYRDMSTTEVEEVKEREGIGEGVKVCAI